MELLGWFGFFSDTMVYVDTTLLCQIHNMIQVVRMKLSGCKRCVLNLQFKQIHTCKIVVHNHT